MTCNEVHGLCGNQCRDGGRQHCHSSVTVDALGADFQYASQGFRVIPLYANLDDICTCGWIAECRSPAKHQRCWQFWWPSGSTARRRYGCRPPTTSTTSSIHV